MILVNCPLKQKDIIELIESYKIDDTQVFKFSHKKHVQLYFNSILENDEEGCSIIRGLIKSYKYSPAIIFNVVSCNGETINWYQ